MVEISNILTHLHTVLEYEHEGNYTRIKEIFDRCECDKISNDKFFYHNLFQSLWMAGIINVSWEGGTIRWVNNSELNLIETNSGGMQVLRGKNLLEGTSKAFIYDSNNNPLAFYKNNKARENGIIWNKEIFSRFESFSSLVDASLERVSVATLNFSSGSYFDFTKYEWLPSQNIDYSRSGLFKVFHERRGYAFYLFDMSTGFAYRFSDVEWMFLVACYILNIDYRRVLNFEESIGVSVPSIIRLPVLISRYLVSASEAILLGVRTVYKGISESSYSNLLVYLNSEGDHD